MRPFKHLEVSTIDELFEVLEKYRGKVKVNAGGTDLLSLFKDEYLFSYPEFVLNIKPIRELEYIKEDDGLLKIGALTKLSTLFSHPTVERFKALKEAIVSIGSPQIRNMGTVGGNLCQDIRCWYYRYPKRLGGPLMCARKGEGPCLAVSGDNRYHALFGKKCFAVCPSDLAVALAVLGAKIVILGPKGERKVSIDEFYHPFGTILEIDEILKEVQIPKDAEEFQQNFIKFTLRRPIDFAIVSVATSIKVEEGIVKTAAIRFGGCSYGPFRPLKAEEFLIGKAIKDEVLENLSELSVSEFKPLSKNGYKIEILKSLLKRSVKCGKS